MYKVYIGCDEIGTVNLQKDGLYYRINCVCKLSGQVICCLVATSDTCRVNLGTLIPQNGFFQLKTSLPIKKLTGRDIRFAVEPKHPQQMHSFVTIRAEEPFLYLERLSQACLSIKNDVIGVVFLNDTDQKVNSSPTGQWSEPNTSE